MTNIRIFRNVRHHSLKVALLLALGAFAIKAAQGGWLLETAFEMTLTAAVIFGVLGHQHEAVTCSKCRPKPPNLLKRLRYRAWALYGRYGWALLTLALLTWVAISLLLPSKHSPVVRGVVHATLATLVITYLAAKRFILVNYDGFEPARPLRRFVRERCSKLIHKGHWLVAGALAVSVVTAIAPHGGPWLAVGPVIMVTLLAGLYLHRQHSLSLCELCVTEFRTDAADYAARHRWRFTALHRGTKIFYPVMVPALISEFFLPHPWDTVSSRTLDTLVIPMLLLERFHTGYQLWCPHCRHGGGGGEYEEAPDPTPDHGQPIPV